MSCSRTNSDPTPSAHYIYVAVTNSVGLDMYRPRSTWAVAGPFAYMPTNCQSVSPDARHLSDVLYVAWLERCPGLVYRRPFPGRVWVNADKTCRGPQQVPRMSSF